jgi:serine protease AprX
MDTGIADHPDLAGSVVGRFDFVHDGAPSLDPGGHGTFLAGLIAAHGATFKGVAPDAKLVSLRVLNANGVGTLHSVLAAFDWVLRNRTTYGIRVVNISWGTAQTTSYQRDLLAGVVESAWFAGVTVVAAAGNDGPLPGTVSSPAADPFVISAGSLDDDGTPAHEDDRESTFSGRGPTRDGFAKPDLLAPGEHVVSLRVPGTGPSPYRKLTGTSASAAFVSGAAALLLQAHASYSPTDVKGALVAGGYRVTAAVTPGLDAANALAVQPARVNADLAPSRVLISLLAKTGAFTDARQWGVSWEGVSWERLRWQTISWESVSWEAVSWDAVSWDAVTWEQRR